MFDPRPGSAERLTAVRASLAEQSIDRLVVTSRENVRYLSGFSGSSGWAVVGREDAALITDFRYREQAEEQAPGWRIEVVKRGVHRGLREMGREWSGARVGYESAHLTMRDYDQLTNGALEDAADAPPPPAVEWVGTNRVVENAMARKDSVEIDAIAEAARITDRVFDELLGVARVGVTERELAAEVEYRSRKLGGEGTAFPPIVASGPRAALPHAEPSDRAIEPGDMVTIDIGVKLDGYASDMTRTIAVGSASERLREIYAVVLDAQTTALDAVRPGIGGSELDAIAREHIDRQGFGEAFGHSLGHGVGLRIHEAPAVGPRSTETLEAGMVVTVEPGIYLPGWGGVRIEDIAVVTDEGRRVLSETTKELIVV